MGSPIGWPDGNFRLWQWRATARSSASAALGQRSAASRCRSATWSSRTVMRFSVSVPVLSVRITVALPSVSTAGRWRTSALRFAMRCVASARASVTVGNSPSGTLATMMPMANMALAQNGRPMAWPTAKNDPPRTTASVATSFETRRISACSGDSVSPAVWVRWAIRPNSVPMPVA